MLSPYLMITAAVNLFFTELLIKFCLYIFVAGTPFSCCWKFRAYFIRLIQLFKRENQTVRRAKPCLAGLPGTRAVPRGGHSPARRSGLLGGCPQCPAILSLSSLCSCRVGGGTAPGGGWQGVSSRSAAGPPGSAHRGDFRGAARCCSSATSSARTAAASAPAPGEPRGSPGPLLLPRSPPPRPAEPRRPRHPAGSYLGRVQGGQQGQQQEPGDAAGRPHPGAGAASPRLSPRLTPLPPRAPRLPPQPDWKRRRQRQPPGGRSFRGRARTALPVVPERLRCPAPARLRPAPARPSAKLRAREAVARMRHHGCRPPAARPLPARPQAPPRGAAPARRSLWRLRPVTKRW